MSDQFTRFIPLIRIVDEIAKARNLPDGMYYPTHTYQSGVPELTVWIKDNQSSKIMLGLWEWDLDKEVPKNPPDPSHIHAYCELLKGQYFLNSNFMCQLNLIKQNFGRRFNNGEIDLTEIAHIKFTIGMTHIEQAKNVFSDIYRPIHAISSPGEWSYDFRKDKYEILDMSKFEEDLLMLRLMCEN